VKCGGWLSRRNLHRVQDRISTVYVKRSHVDRDDNAVVVVNQERVIRVPAAMVASLLLGPGTRITSGAVRLLADSGTAICWVGERGVPMYASGIGTSRGTRFIERQAYLGHPRPGTPSRGPPHVRHALPQ